MSYISGLDISITGNQMVPLNTIKALLEYGWSYNDNGQITYLPIGDAGLYNWQYKPLKDWEKVKKIISQKNQLGELVGLILTWKKTQIGGGFHFHSQEQSLSINWSVNRKKLNEGYTDHSWYIAKVLKPICSIGLNIESFECNDIP